MTGTICLESLGIAAVGLCTALMLTAACAPAQAAVDDSRVALTGAPPFSYGASLEVVGGPLGLRADATNVGSSIGGWAVSLQAQVAEHGGARMGVLAGIVQPYHAGACPAMPGIPCNPGLSPGRIGFLLGLHSRWEAGPWWIHLTPNLTLTPEMPIPAIPGSGLPPMERPPRIDWHYALVIGPPWLEVGYRLTPTLDVSLRSSLAPLALGWRF